MIAALLALSCVVPEVTPLRFSVAQFFASVVGGKISVTDGAEGVLISNNAAMHQGKQAFSDTAAGFRRHTEWQANIKMFASAGRIHDSRFQGNVIAFGNLLALGSISFGFSTI